jgi:hypothetical protein
MENKSKVIISRRYQDTETLGTLLVMKGIYIIFECKTIELPFINNEKNISCIPEGVYKTEKIISPTKGECFIINNVPNRTAILLHKGNYATGKKVDTQGCILPGLKFVDINNDGEIDVENSTAAMKSLLEVLPDKFDLHIL